MFNNSTDKICVFSLPIKELHPHPSNPRKDLGDLSELVESIRSIGLQQNLTVVPDRDAEGKEIEDSYTVIIGHRRLAAAKEAGLWEVPCAINRYLTPAEQIAVMLHENMQRRQLTPLEEGLGFQQLQLEFGWDVNKISYHSGFSETTVRNRLRVAQFDTQKVKKAYEERQPKLIEFEALSKVQNEETRNELLEKIGTFGFMADVQTAISKEQAAAFMEELKTVPQLNEAIHLPAYEAWDSGKYQKLATVPAPADGKVDDNFINALPTLPPRQKQHYIYYDRDSKELKFYTKVKAPSRPKPTADELREKEKIAQAWTDLEELGRKYYARRKNFIKEVPCHSREQLLLVMQGALYAGISEASRYQTLGVLTVMEEILGIESNPDTYSIGEQRRIQLVKKLYEIPKSRLAEFVYQLFNDEDAVISYGWSTRTWPVWREKAEKLALYAWLESMGYETSEEEKELLDGSHEIFQRGVYKKRPKTK